MTRLLPAQSPGVTTGDMKRILFADFDGTITKDETFVAILKHFAPELAADIIPRMLALEVPLRVGVRRILESVESARYPEILAFIRHKRLRDGFVELLDFLDERGVPLVIVSGGLRDVVLEILGPLARRVAAIHAIEVDLSGPRLHVVSEWEAGTELVSKVDVIASYGDVAAACVGDSVTDLNMALSCPLVFARDRLAGYLDERSVPYEPYDDFRDVRCRLNELWVD